MAMFFANSLRLTFFIVISPSWANVYQFNWGGDANAGEDAPHDSRPEAGSTNSAGNLF